MRRWESRKPFKSVQYVFNSKLNNLTRQSFSYKVMPKTSSSFYSKNSVGRNYSTIKRSKTRKSLAKIKEVVKSDIKPKRKENKREEEDKPDEELKSIIKSTNNNIEELKSEFLKLETKCLRMENDNLLKDTARFNDESDVKKDIIKSIKEENHRLVLAEMRANAEFVKSKDHGHRMERENMSLREKISTQADHITRLQSEIQLLRQELNAKNNACDEFEYDKRKTALKAELDEERIRSKEENIKILRDQLTAETKDKNSYMQKLNDQLIRNTELESQCKQLKEEGKSLIETVEMLQIEIKQLHISNQTALDYIKGRDK